MRITLFIACLLFGHLLDAQGVLFEAKASANRVFEGSFVTIEFSLENANGSDFSAPSFNGFTITGGPSKSTSKSIINGKVTQSISYSYELTPKKIGRLTIGSASIKANGKLLKSKPIQIEVIKQDEKSKRTQAENFFIRLEVSDSLVQIGQQITLEYVLYTKIDIRSQKYMEKPEYDGFFAEDLRISRSAYRTDIINGTEYYYKVMDRVALFPQQTGNYTFGPVRFRLGAATEGERSGFFFNQRLKYFIAESNTINIKVGDFSNAAPASFSGAVGKYEMSIRVPQTRISADDALNILMTIKGDGDSRTVNPPAQSFGDDLDNYDPNTISDKSYVSGGKIMNEKTFEYIAVPRRTGQYVIKPEFTYYDVDSSKYITLEADSIQFFVSPGTGVNKIRSDEKISKKELRPFSDETSLEKRRTPFFRSTIYWSILAALFGLLIAIFYKYWRAVLDSKIDPKLKKSQIAKDIALSRLSKADELIASGQNKEAFAEISKSFKEYVSDKWLIDYSTLNTKSILELFKSKNISASHIESAEYCLNQCEMAIYAGADNHTLSKVREHMAALIEGLEKNS